MLTIDDIRALRPAYSHSGDADLMDALRQIGNPSQESLIDYCVRQMSHPDRNARVLMLRILARYGGKRARAGVLAGLNDDARRVVAVAIQACPNYLSYQDIAERLEAIARGDGATRKLCRRALSMLAGNEGRWRGDLTPVVCAALQGLMAENEYRFSILFGLVRLESAPRTRQLLEEFARSDDPRERDMARRALAGERVIHIDAYTDDPDLHQHIRQTCEIAHGRMFYWLPPAGIAARTLAPS